MKVTELAASRIVQAGRESVFAAWTRPDLLRQWWGPPPYTCPEAEMDLRVGGHYRIANRHPDGEVIWISGEFLEVDPPSMLRYTWQLSTHATGASVVQVEFLPHADGTEIRVRHERFSSEAVRDQHLDGWTGCLGKLDFCLQAIVVAQPAGEPR